MSAPAFNQVCLPSFDSEHPLDLLPLDAFISMFQYDIDRLYIDRFWSSISADSWIVVDYAMLHWMGYDNTRVRDSKRHYLRMLYNNFVCVSEFDEVSAGDPRVGALEGAPQKVLIMRSRPFKESLMLLQTDRSKTIRRYYTALEQIFLDYSRYSAFVREHNTALEIAELRASIDQYRQMKLSAPFDIDPRTMVHTEYVYVLTSRRYYRQCMFKIGKTTNLKSRLPSLNTTAAMDDDTMFYTHTIATFDSGALEKNLHRAMSRYHHSKEWYRIPHQHMIDIIRCVVANEDALLSLINKQLSAGNFESVGDVPIEQFIDATVHTNSKLVDKPKRPNATTCTKCGKVYVSMRPYEKHIAICHGCKCARCDKVFINLRDLEVHNNNKVKCADVHATPTKTEPESKPFTCQTCGRQFTTQTRYDNHVDGGCKYHNPCSACDRVFSGATALKKHLRTHQEHGSPGSH